MVQRMQLSRSYKITTIVFAIIHLVLMAFGVVQFGQEASILVLITRRPNTGVDFDLAVIVGRFLFGSFFLPYNKIRIGVIVSSVIEGILFLLSMERAYCAMSYVASPVVDPKPKRTLGKNEFFTILKLPNHLKFKDVDSISCLNLIVYTFGLVFSIVTIVIMVKVYRKHKKEGRERLSTGSGRNDTSSVEGSSAPGHFETGHFGTRHFETG